MHMPGRFRTAIITAVLGACIVVTIVMALVAANVLLANRSTATARTDPTQWMVSPSANSPGRILPRLSPLVLAHRGASAQRPENTLGAYRLAIEMGTDYLEGDLVISKDGVLVVRHDRELSMTTDVALHPEFASRRVTKQVDNVAVTDWFVEDFTVPELKTLRAVSRKQPGATTAGQAAAKTQAPGPRVSGPPPPDETVPTLEEMINLARVEAASRHRPIGIYVELKTPAFFESRGWAPVSLLVAALREADIPSRDVPAFVESFDAASLRLFNEQMIEVPLIQLIGGIGGIDDPAVAPETLAKIATYATGIGIARERLETPETPGPDRTIIDVAHRADLEVHVYTFTAPGPTEDPLSVYRRYYAAGVDGVFSDSPDNALAARR